MPSNVNTNGDLTQRSTTHAKARFLKRAQENMILERWGNRDPLPQNKGSQVTWRRYNPISSLPATAPLAEGVTPTAKKRTYTDVSVTVQPYGDLVEISREVKLYHEDPIFKDTFNALGEQGAEVVEYIRWYALRAGTNVYFAQNASARTTVNSPPLLSDLKRIERGFRLNRAQKFTEIIKASAKIATEPIPACFPMFSHSNLKANWEDVPTWVPIHNYSDALRALPNEEGSIPPFRIFTSSLFDPWEAGGTSGTEFLSGGVEVTTATACDVYPCITVARDGFGLVPLQGFDSVTPVVLQPKPAPGDPMGRKGSVSYTVDQAAKILTQAFVARLEAACSAIPPTGE